MATVSWSTPGAADTLASTELNALADATGVLGAEIDNSGDKKLYMDVELLLSAATGVGTDAYVGLYLMPALDGINYPTPTTATVTPNYWVGSLLGVDQGGTARTITRAMLQRISIPPFKFKMLVVNQLNAAFPATTNTLKGFRYGETVA